MQARGFALTGQARRSLEAVAAAVRMQEPVLLVGETGSGKTTLLQHLADRVRPLCMLARRQHGCSSDACTLACNQLQQQAAESLHASGHSSWAGTAVWAVLSCLGGAVAAGLPEQGPCLQVGARLVALNLSQQTDSSDFVGGFRPVEARTALLPLLDAFQVRSSPACLPETGPPRLALPSTFPTQEQVASMVCSQSGLRGVHHVALLPVLTGRDREAFCVRSSLATWAARQAAKRVRERLGFCGQGSQH